ncbi:hypothetical protein JXA12_02290 [Candidatus Woesearchaeota archaeon]|nr:hypothetical protein [Candidatus Woesearchaeota archaeon]
MYDNESLTTTANARPRPIPITVFSDKLSPLETIVKYLKENEGLTATAIAALLNRSPSTITTTYANATQKHPHPFTATTTSLTIPLAVIKYRKLSTSEAIVMYLHHYEQLSFATIATHLHRDNRVIWTVHKRASTKTTKERFLNDLTTRIERERKQLTPEDKKKLFDLKQRLQEKYGFSEEELKHILTKTASTHLPITIFTQGLPPLQAITRYLHDEQVPTKKIAKLLRRPAAQISNAYHHAKKQEFKPQKTPYHVSTTCITQDKTIMEAITHELKQQYKLTNDQLATLLKKKQHSIDRWLRNHEKKR